MRTEKLIGEADYSHSYSFSMRDAHRKPSQPITAPALSWHLGFKKEQSYSGESRWIERIELLIIDFLFNLINCNLQPNASVGVSNLGGTPNWVRYNNDGERNINLWQLEKFELIRNIYDISNSKIKRISSIKPEGSRYETVVINGSWKNLPLWIRIEVFEEFFTITTTISFRKKIEGDKYNEYMLSFKNMVEEISRDLETIDPPRKNEIIRNIQPHAENVYNSIWKDFKAAIFSSAFSKSDNEREIYTGDNQDDIFNLKSIRSNKIGSEIFADFRGIIFSLAESNGKTWANFHKPGDPGDNNHKMLHSERVNANAKQFIGNSGIHFAEKLFPVLLSMEEKRSSFPPPFEVADYTFSTFDRRRCLYGSSFGPQNEKNPTPLYYVLLSAHDERRQLGRVLNRLHLLGTLRLAALFDFDKIVYKANFLSIFANELLHAEKTDYNLQLFDRKKKSCAHAIKKIRDVNFSLKDFSQNLINYFDNSPFKVKSNHYLESIPKFSKILNKLNDDLILIKISPENTPLDQSTLITKSANSLIFNAKENLIEINNITQELVEIIDSIWKLESNSEKLGDALEVKMKKIRNELSSIQRDIDVIFCNTVSEYKRKILENVNIELHRVDDSIKYGIAYRAERSKYIQDQFASLSDAMRIGNIEGFQRYDVFVRHRLARSYNLISSFGTTYDRLTKKVSFLEKKFSDEDHANKVIAATKIQDEKSAEQNHLLKTTEILTAVILVPHYLGDLLHSLQHFFSEINEYFPTIIHSPPPHFSKESLTVFSLILSVTVYFAYFNQQKVGHIRMEDDIEKK